MPQDIRVIQCLICKTYQCETIKKDPQFICKLCGASQLEEQEVFRGSSRECRITCMRLNNQRMESDQGFMDINPQDLMNESYRSELDSSFMLNRSKSFSPPSNTVQEKISIEQYNSSLNTLSDSIQNDSFDSINSDSPDRDSKRKYTAAVTPQKEDMRELKRARQSNPFKNIQQTKNNSLTLQILKNASDSPRIHRFDKNIRAQFKYQHLMTSDENYFGTKFRENSNNFKPSTTTPSLWNAFVDSDMME
uniref:CSON015430 protein n=1 Tax=Culicoides sonorensis TaxID=179676 RepID=A0A336LTV8_CULSO